MICIHCKSDAKYKERLDGRCPSCRHRFAFEPKTGSPVTDGAFASAIARVSSDGKVKWTKGHLYYEIARRTQKKRAVAVFAVISAVAAAIAVVANVPVLGALALVLAVAAIAGAVKNARRSIQLSPADFESLLQRWVLAHGQPAALVIKKPGPPAKARALPSDIAGYSFDRAVICDRPDTVDLLLANNFHFENNCAVLSEHGYPEVAFPVVLSMLKKNPKLVVYVLHDATVDGCSLAQRLRGSEAWFATGARVIDVGLSPRHARRFKGLWTEMDFGGLAPVNPDADNAWLARYALGLAVIRPEQVIKRLFRAISGTPDALREGLSADALAFDSDAAVSDGGGDSFG